MRLENGIKKGNRIQLAKIADKVFTNHKLIPEQIEGSVQMWHCGERGTGIYSYRVIAAPGILLVYGDVGNHMLRASDHDLIPWLRGAIKSEQYLISKFINKGEIFLPEEATNLLEELFNKAESDEEREKINNVHFDWDADHDGFEMFCKALAHINKYGSLVHRTIDYEPSIYWTVECLKKFVELLDDDTEENISFSTCSSFFGANVMSVAA